MTQLGPGRPRLAPRRRAGQTPRAEILDAAAELFTSHGYGNTSTRAVADAVGIRQASLYHHFAAKDDILDALLAETVTTPLELASALAGQPEPAVVRLYALAWYDVTQLCASRWNLGALYLLPELRSERFARFRERRDELRGHYETLSAAVIAEAAGAPGAVLAEAGAVAGAELLPFRLVESVINMRSDEGAAPEYAGQLIPDAILRLLCWSGSLAETRVAALELARRLAPE
ncbi:TetR/AcrR family transcriptional regulator [Nocardia niigatensis]|uniref:TetR/AcrR family transcriptional regulator n=1 Tax=Nocardia niigatensis TaxID=209249 RepID=UPI0002DCA521|nr:TetR/AcrR family transcriptional regulator [Nocardia niigatensis]